MIRRVALALLLLVSVIALPTLAEQPVPPQFLAAYQACLITGSKTIPIELEQATKPIEQRYGLMERHSLPDDSGMLFIYPAERGASAGFWMYRTRLPLDIAWLDDKGVILAIDTMVPCDTESARNCPSWSPGVRHRHVLEMNAGFFSRTGVVAGDILKFHLNSHYSCPAVN